ncbi:DUF6064 family protein [Inquilinus limosus]|uniref:MFS transporter permease n=1 Tax=Inquilinus limosus TaxID=171674 RepID=A0A211ZGZ9_9PROT|nr:DUF6064 family protein [Inquilinus limosus]OWJ64466.1 hypothetical protein BWR60_24585 [Inquilinus limosus]
MSEWWSYRLSDFLLFSPRTYHRLFELYNEAVWPAQAAAVLAGLLMLLLLRRGGAVAGPAVAAILAVCWAWVAIAFHLDRYATINWAASWLAGGFLAQAALLVWAGAIGGRLSVPSLPDAAGRAGMGIFLLALLVWPAIGLLLGRSWRQAEIFGVAPDPTAIGTLGLLLALAGPGRWVLMILPVLWCVATGATLWAMSAPEAWVAPAAALLAVILAVWQGLQRRRDA